MCLGEIARVLAVGPGSAATVLGERGEARISLLTLEAPVDRGDWVLVHSGFALARLSDDEAYAAFTVRTHEQEAPR